MHILGLDDAAGPIYLWWSGFGLDLGLFGAIGLFYWKHTCHQRNCYKIARHSPNGTPYCTRHHPKLRGRHD